MTVKVKPRFHIIENYDDAPDYGLFKEDYLNPNTSMKDLMEKYDISKGTYKRLAKQVREETGLHKKPTSYFGNGISHQFGFNRDLYLRKRNGNYSIVKTIGYQTRSYGSYPDIETARMVRDKLVECEWDDKTAMCLKVKYGNQVKKPALDKAKKLYPRFKELYSDGRLKMYEILELMNITPKVYYYMVEMFRDEVRNDNG